MSEGEATKNPDATNADATNADATTGEPQKKAKKAKKSSTKEGSGEAAAEGRKEFAPVGALPARTAYALALLSGVLYFLGFPGVDLWPISLFALVPLIVAMRGQTPRAPRGSGGWPASR
jgi:apolipoprotein N-acyltransferase